MQRVSTHKEPTQNGYFYNLFCKVITLDNQVKCHFMWIVVIIQMGLTTMCVFRQGDYDGAFLTFPRYGVAVNIPDNSVVSQIV